MTNTKIISYDICTYTYLYTPPFPFHQGIGHPSVLLGVTTDNLWDPWFFFFFPGGVVWDIQPDMDTFIGKHMEPFGHFHGTDGCLNGELMEN